MNKRELKALDLSNTYSGKYWQRLKMASYRLIKFQGRAVAAAFFFSGFMLVSATGSLLPNKALADTTVGDPDSYIIQVDTDDGGAGSFQVQDFDGANPTTTVIQADAQTTTLNSNVTDINGSELNVDATTTDINSSITTIDSTTTITGTTSINTTGTAATTIGNSTSTTNLNSGTTNITGTISDNTGNVTVGDNLDVSGDVDVDGFTTTDGISNDGGFTTNNGTANINTTSGAGLQGSIGQSNYQH